MKHIVSMSFNAENCIAKPQQLAVKLLVYGLYIFCFSFIYCLAVWIVMAAYMPIIIITFLALKLCTKMQYLP